MRILTIQNICRLANRALQLETTMSHCRNWILQSFSQKKIHFNIYYFTYKVFERKRVCHSLCGVVALSVRFVR